MNASAKFDNVAYRKRRNQQIVTALEQSCRKSGFELPDSIRRYLLGEKADINVDEVLKEIEQQTRLH